MEPKFQETFKRYNEEISSYIRPSTFPLAIKMMTNLEAPHPQVRRTKKDLDWNLFLCQALGIARRQGFRF